MKAAVHSLSCITGSAILLKHLLKPERYCCKQQICILGHNSMFSLMLCVIQDAVASALPEEGQAARVLVFAGTVAAANGVANALEEVGIPTHLYHKSISAADRAAALQRMSE